MASLIKSSAFIYSTAAFVVLFIVLTLIIHFNWPLVASVVLGSTLFVHILVVAEKVFENWKKANRKGLTGMIIHQLKADLPIFGTKSDADIEPYNNSR